MMDNIPDEIQWWLEAQGMCECMKPRVRRQRRVLFDRVMEKKGDIMPTIEELVEEQKKIAPVRTTRGELLFKAALEEAFGNDIEGLEYRETDLGTAYGATEAVFSVGERRYTLWLKRDTTGQKTWKMDNRNICRHTNAVSENLQKLLRMVME